MKTINLIAIISIMAVSSTAWAARVSDACSQNLECSNDGRLVCEASNCLEPGKFTITLAWNADTDLDLSVETPGGLRIGAADSLEADSGRLTIDECYDADRCGSSEHPHVEHVVWGFDDVTPLGRYRLEVLNFDGRNAAEYRIHVTRPDGHRFVLEGKVDAGAGQKSEETFKLEATTHCSDRDHDGLCDLWETQGIDFDDDGEVDLDLPGLGANPDRKDIFVEVDWMPGAKPYGLDLVVDSFADAPVQNPDGSQGVTLHVQMSEEIKKMGGNRVKKKQPLDDRDLGLAKFGRRGFDESATSCQAGWFGSRADRESDNCEAIIRAKQLVYRYAIFAYKRKGTTSSGRGELPGDDLIVSTKAWRSNDQELENATFMHELGHNLGLFHGGHVNHNCKPNYLSVMNYFYQTTSLYAGRPLDFSRQKLAVLDETALIEFDGISGLSTWEQVVFQGPDGSVVTTDTDASQPIDWNQNDDLDVDVVSVHVSDGDECSQPGVARKLESHDDWGALLYNFRATKNYGVAWGTDEASQEMTEEQYERMASASDSDVDGHSNLEDNCPVHSNPDQKDTDGDGVGDVCDACPEAPAPGFVDGCDPTASSVVDEDFRSDITKDISGPPGVDGPHYHEPNNGCSSTAGGAETGSLFLLLLVGMLARRQSVTSMLSDGSRAK